MRKLILFIAIILLVLLIRFSNTNFVATGSVCKTQNAECDVNNSEKLCCAGLVCMDAGHPSDNGHCEVESSPTAQIC
jgi:hypothetical protein